VRGGVLSKEKKNERRRKGEESVPSPLNELKGKGRKGPSHLSYIAAGEKVKRGVEGIKGGGGEKGEKGKRTINPIF